MKLRFSSVVTPNSAKSPIFIKRNRFHSGVSGGKNCRGENCPWAQSSENNSATRATIHKRIDVRERPRIEILHKLIRL